MGEIACPEGLAATLGAFGLESEDWEEWLRPDLNDQVIVVRAACDRCLSDGYGDAPIWYN